MTEVWWEVKNLHFRPWGDWITLRVHKNSDLELPPIKINKALKPLETFQVKIRFRQPANMIVNKDELFVHLSLYDEDEKVFFGDDLCLKLTY